MSSDQTKIIPIQSRRNSEASDETADSERLRPYKNAAEAIFTKHGLEEALAEISRLPLEERYVWKILLALKWGLSDLDTFNVVLDRKTLSPEDRKTLADLIVDRPVQFCAFLKALLGEETMEQMMTQAIAAAKKIPSVT
jgi:hypothetical protein